MALPNGVKELKVDDHLGSTRALIAGGGTTTSYDYNPWGGLLGGTALRKSFIDKEKDKESGLSNFGVREYTDDADGGRFLRPDRLREKFPDQTPYGYADNNPVVKKDPSGDCPTCLVGAIVGAVVEYGSQVVINHYVNGQSWGDAATNVDVVDIGIAAAAGAVSGGINSLETVGMLGKAALSGGLNVAQGAAKAKLGSQTSSYGPGDIAADFGLGMAAQAVGDAAQARLQKGPVAKDLYRQAGRLANIAKAGRPRPAQTMRALAARAAAKLYGGGKVATTLNGMASGLAGVIKSMIDGSGSGGAGNGEGGSVVQKEGANRSVRSQTNN